MNHAYKSLLCLALAPGFFLPSLAIAQKSSGGVVGEARLHPSTAWSSSSNSMYRSQGRWISGDSSNNGYNNSGYVIRSEAAPAEVAQMPSDERRFSYDPAQSDSNTSAAPCGCPCGSASNQTRTQVQPPPAPPAPDFRDRTSTPTGADGGRSFSYDPQTSNQRAIIEGENSGAVNSNVYRAPGSQPSRTSQRNRYSLPKTDPDKYRVN